MFSNSSNYNNSSPNQDPMHRYSITLPPLWYVKDEQWTDDPHLISTCWNRNFDHTVFLLIYRNDTGKSIDWNSFTDKEIHDRVSTSLNEQRMNASETSITRYSDGLKIVSVGLVADDQGRIFSKQKVTTYWFNNGLAYDVKYLAEPTDFDQYIDAAQKSIDTFYVSEKPSQITPPVESIPQEPQNKSYVQGQSDTGKIPNIPNQKQGEDMQNAFYIMVTGIPIFVILTIMLFWFTRK
jgi:hypothetical protein